MFRRKVQGNPPRRIPPLDTRQDELGLAGFLDESDRWLPVQQAVADGGEVRYGWFDIALRDQSRRFATGRLFYTDRSLYIDLAFAHPPRQRLVSRVDYLDLNWFGPSPEGDAFAFQYRTGTGDPVATLVDFPHPTSDLGNHISTLAHLAKQAQQQAQADETMRKSIDRHNRRHPGTQGSPGQQDQ